MNTKCTCASIYANELEHDQHCRVGRTDFTGREQKLVDLCFETVLTATGPSARWFKNKTTEQRAAWVAEQLRGCGFPTSPCGGKWGVLD